MREVVRDKFPVQLEYLAMWKKKLGYPWYIDVKNAPLLQRELGLL